MMSLKGVENIAYSKCDNLRSWTVQYRKVAQTLKVFDTLGENADKISN